MALSINRFNEKSAYAPYLNTKLSDFKSLNKDGKYTIKDVYFEIDGYIISHGTYELVLPQSASVTQDNGGSILNIIDPELNPITITIATYMNKDDAFILNKLHQKVNGDSSHNPDVNYMSLYFEDKYGMRIRSYHTLFSGHQGSIVYGTSVPSVSYSFILMKYNYIGLDSNSFK